MKITVEIADPLFEQVEELATKEGLPFRLLIEEGLRMVLEAKSITNSKPFSLRDGSFKDGQGLQHGVAWTDLSRLAYADEGDSSRVSSRA